MPTYFGCQESRRTKSFDLLFPLRPHLASMLRRPRKLKLDEKGEEVVPSFKQLNADTLERLQKAIEKTPERDHLFEFKKAARDYGAGKLDIPQSEVLRLRPGVSI
jgi:hypothetical protein